MMTVDWSNRNEGEIQIQKKYKHEVKTKQKGQKLGQHKNSC